MPSASFLDPTSTTSACAYRAWMGCVNERHVAVSGGAAARTSAVNASQYAASLPHEPTTSRSQGTSAARARAISSTWRVPFSGSTRPTHRQRTRPSGRARPRATESDVPADRCRRRCARRVPTVRAERRCAAGGEAPPRRWRRQTRRPAGSGRRRSGARAGRSASRGRTPPAPMCCPRRRRNARRRDARCRAPRGTPPRPSRCVAPGRRWSAMSQSLARRAGAGGRCRGRRRTRRRRAGSASSSSSHAALAPD